mgnify:CR=1 FL=1
MNTLIIGDIHGCFDELVELCDRAGIGDGDVVVGVGDVVDRGPQPGEVVDFFRRREGSVVLVYADLRDRASLPDVQRSAVRYKNMEWHFVRVED